MARINAAAVRQTGENHKTKLNVFHDTSNAGNAAYARITGLSAAPNIAVNAELARNAVLTIIPVAAL